MKIYQISKETWNSRKCVTIFMMQGRRNVGRPRRHLIVFCEGAERSCKGPYCDVVDDDDFHDACGPMEKA